MHLDVHYIWAFKRSQDLEGRGENISLLEEWYPLYQPEPRLEHVRWMRHIPFLARVLGVYHYRLGKEDKIS